MQRYECIVVFSTDLNEEAINGEIKKIETIVASHAVGDKAEGKAGAVVKCDLWGRKPLAFKIRKKDYGFYVVMVIEAAGTVVADLDRQLRINDVVLRHLIVLKDKYAPDLSQRLREQTDDASRGNEQDMLSEFLPGEEPFAARM